MLSIHNIWTVARYEIRTLLRSWFFRIFAGLAIAILIMLNIPLFALKGNMPWLFRGISSSIPYLNILFLNVAQAIIAVFLASDFLKRDKKLDTTEVIYMRSMTNGDYVLGKLSGILIVFLALNLIVLAIAAIFNIFFSDVPVVLAAYLFYPIFISVPTLIFIFGLSFLFMVTIRNQAVTFIVLLGYIAITLFFLSQKFNYLFDYMTFNIPLMYSDFVGFGNLSTLLIHRGIYFLLGLGFIFATILLIKRLPQSQTMTRAAAVLAILFIGAAVALGGIYLSQISTGKDLRARMIDLNKNSKDISKVTLLNCDLDLRHSGEEIEVTANLKMKNNTANPMDRCVFSLNPGLTVQRVTANQQNLKFDRNLHLLSIALPQPLAPLATDSLTIVYQGKINEQACYLELDDKTRNQMYRAWMYNVARRFAFIEPDFLLLTPESNWYPVAGLPYGSVYPALPEKDFITFRLAIRTDKNLTAISQGKLVQANDGNFIFATEKPIPQLSLTIGNYEKRSVQVDSVDYSVFNLKNHDYYSIYFKEVGDTLPALIREVKQSFENKLGVSYPYSRLTLVEVPIQFFSYKRPWTISQETVQPEMIFLPEKAVLLDQADFSRMMKWQERRRERSNQTLTPQEIQSQLFKGFINSSLLSSFSGRRFGMGDWIQVQLSYDIFPNYYTFVNNFHSKQWPVFNVALESYLNGKASEGAPPFRRFFIGLSDEEKANLALMEQNLSEIIADPKRKDIVNTVLKSKGAYLFKLIESQLGSEKFQQLLQDQLNQNRFQNVEVSAFIAELRQQFNFDLEPNFNTWYEGRHMPGFLLVDVEAYKILDNDRTRFQIKFKVSNPEAMGGLLSVTFRTGGEGGRFFGFGRGPQEPTIERLIALGPGQTKEIGVILDDSPRVMTVNTLISRNLPAVLNRNFDELELKEKVKPFEGERIIDEPIKLVQPNEIVVDNEDAGFELLYNPKKNWLKQLLRTEQAEEKYSGINFWQAPNRWRATTYDEFYGKFIHSAYYIRSGKGDKKVAWNAEIKESGNYEIYYHAAQIRTPWVRRDRGERGRESLVDQIQFLIHHDDGVSEMTLDVGNAEPGWSLLGSYYISAGTAKVELTDKSKGQLIYADAVKWVKR